MPVQVRCPNCASYLEDSSAIIKTKLGDLCSYCYSRYYIECTKCKKTIRTANIKSSYSLETLSLSPDSYNLARDTIQYTWNDCLCKSCYMEVVNDIKKLPKGKCKVCNVETIITEEYKADSLCRTCRAHRYTCQVCNGTFINRVFSSELASRYYCIS